MTDEPNRPPDTPDETRGRTEAEGTQERPPAQAASTPQTETPAPSAGEVERAGTLPPPPDAEAPRPTPESQAALTGKAPSGSSVAGTTVPAATDAEQAGAAAAPPAQAETPEQKKARLIAEHKAKLTAKAAAQGEAAAGEKGVPGGASPAVGDPAQSPSQADLEKAAKIAEAKARAAAMKEAAGAKTPAAAGAAGAGAPKAPVKKKDEGPKPEDASAHPLVRALRERFADAVTEATTFLGQLSVKVARESVVEVCRHLREDAETPFNYLSDLTCVHWPERFDAPFEIVYNLYSIPANQRVRLRVAVDEAAGVESVTGVWPSANWMEREVFDLYGVRFANHPDLRRLLLPPDWTGHPFRKDYPLEFMENNWTTKHLPEFTEVQREQLEQRRAYGLEALSTPDERRVRELFRAGKELLPKEHR